MKRILVVLFVVAFFSPLCFAQQTSIPLTQATPTPAETKTFTGKVSSVSLGGSTMSFGSFGKKGNSEGKKKEKKKGKSKGKKPGSLTLVDEKGQEQSFTVNTDTLVTAKNGKTLKLNEIRKGDKVMVTYTTDLKEGTREVVAIKLVASRGMLTKIKEFIGPVGIR